MISFRLYDRNGTTLLGLLAEPTAWSLSTEFNEVGALTIEYPATGINASSIAEMREIAVVDETGVEYTNARFVISGIDTDRTSSTGTINVSARSILYRLDTALAYPTGGVASGEISRFFDIVSAGTVLKTLIDDAKTRGALSGITYTFTSTLDSNGQAWGDTVTQEYPARTSILSVLRSLSDLGLVEVQTDARVLKATKPDGIGTDRTTGATPLILRYGHNITEAPEQVSAEKLASVALVEGDEGLIVERSNAGAVSIYGRLETSFTASGIDDAAVVSSVGDAYLETVAGASRQLTVGLALHDGAPVPFKDFTVGDYVYTATSTGLERVRVRQIIMSMSGGAVFASATLGDRIFEAEIRNARRLSGITSGSVSLGNGTLPTSTPVVSIDAIAPAAPTTLTGTAASYLDGNQIRGRVNLSWTAPTLNADGSALTDLRQYEIEFRQLTSDPWQYAGATSGTTFTISNLTKNTQYRFRVAAVDSSNNRSSYSNVFVISTPGFVELPTQPSTPILTTRLGVLTVKWDGLNYIGGAMSIDLDYVAIYVGTTAGFTPSASNYRGRVYGPDLFHVSGLTYGTTYHVKFVAYSTSGVNSPTSNSASATIVALVDTDLIANTLTTWPFNGAVVSTTALANGAVNAAKLTDGAVTASKILDGAVSALKIADGAVSAAKIATGAVGSTQLVDGAVSALKIADGAVASAKIATGAVGSNQISAGAIIAGKISANAVTAAEIAAGSITSAKIVAGAITAVEIASGAITTNKIAAGAITAQEIATGAITSAKITAGAIGATEIAAGAITAAKISAGAIGATEIAANAIVAGKIAANAVTAGTVAALAIEAGKIAANAITADKIEAGAITAVKIATNAITADKIQAGAITTDKLTAGTLTGFTINNGSGTFQVTSGGNMTASSGNIGGFTITSTYIGSSDASFYINSSNGNARFNTLFINTGSGSAGITMNNGGNISMSGGNVNMGTGNVNNAGTVTASTLTSTGNISASGTITSTSDMTSNGELRAVFGATNSVTNNASTWMSSTGQLRRVVSSSERYKTDIVTLTDVAELDPKKLLALPVRAFRYKPEHLSESDDRSDALMPGFIAEEVDAIYPIAADYQDGPESWNDRILVPALLALVQDLNARVAELEAGN